MGRSYGDAAQNAGGIVLDATWLDGIHSVDLDAGRITVGAGVSLADPDGAVRAARAGSSRSPRVPGW